MDIEKMVGEALQIMKETVPRSLYEQVCREKDTAIRQLEICKSSFGVKQTVYVLHRYWDTPDNEGNEILGVYLRKEDAQAKMKLQSFELTKEFEHGVWEEDYTWESESEIHLGFDPHQAFEPCTTYCWEITKMEVQ